jgi:type II secretory pathway pseudopilin PulG
MTKFRKQHSTKQLGFTMIELLVVATIIILLTTIGIISYRQASISSRNGKRKADLETIRQALVMRRSDTGGYPTGDFSAMVTTLKNDGYLSDDSTDFRDPSGAAYVYAGSGCSGPSCTGFTLTATLEPSGTYELKNP